MITEITFPKVTVCPPKNTYTDLNYDLMMTENMTLDNDTRNELINNANEALCVSFAKYLISEYNNTDSSNIPHENGKETLYDTFYKVVMRNLSKLEDDDRYYNWYHCYTEIGLPYYDTYGLNYRVRTAATWHHFHPVLCRGV